MDRKVYISKIEFSGFAAIKTQNQVEVSPNFNLLFGSANHLKTSICLAIEFMLSRLYEPNYVAITCLHPEVSAENYEAYVTLHLSSAKKFQLNRKNRKTYKVTRYLHHEDVNNVYYGSRKNYRNRQSIEMFHAQLSALNLRWIDDPIISQRIRATSTEMRQMLTNALGCPDLLKDRMIRQCYEKFKITNVPLAKLFRMLKSGTDKERKYLSELHSLEMVLLTKKIAQLRGQIPNMLNRCNMAKNYDNYMLIECVNDMEDAQAQQFDAYNQAIDDALELTISMDFIDSNELRTILNEFSSAWEQFIEETDADRTDHWDHEGNNQMVVMRANLSDYFVGAAGVSADDKAICQNAIDAIDNQLGTVLHTTQNVQQIEVHKRKILSDLMKMVDEMDVLENDLDTVARNILMAKVKGFQLMKLNFNFTMILNWTHIRIKTFCMDQSVIHPAVMNAWQKGLSALTHRTAYKKKFPQNFKGNPFDFITLPGSDKDLTLAFAYVAAIMPYFATFFFDAPAHVTHEFESLIESFSEVNSHLYICSNDQYDADRLNQLPYESLASILLSKETCRQNEMRFIKNWFDQFRVTTDDTVADELRQEAVLMNCKILNETRCYSEDGSVREICHDLPMDILKLLLHEWQLSVGVRRKNVKVQGKKYELTTQMDVNHPKHLNNLEAEQSEGYFEISDSLFMISIGIREMVKLAHLSIEANDLESLQTMKLNVYREQMRLFETDISNLDIGEITVRQSADDQLENGIINTINKFENCVEKITNILCDGKLPQQLTNEMEKFEGDINKLRLEHTDMIEFKAEIVDRSKPQMNHWNEYVRNKMHYQIEWQLMYELGRIKMHPELFDRKIIKGCTELQIDDLEYVKNEFLEQRSIHFAATDLNVDIDSLNETCELIDINLSWLTDSIPTNDQIFETETHFSGIYFDRLPNALRILNEMIVLPSDDEMVGIELCTPNDSVDIFHDAIDRQWHQQFPMDTLRQYDTKLRFITKIDRNSELLDVNSNRYCSLFHVALSLSMQLSLIIVNNSIIGMSSEEFRKLVFWLKRRMDVDDKQIILVQRSNDGIEPFRRNQIDFIRCFSRYDDTTMSSSNE